MYIQIEPIDLINLIIILGFFGSIGNAFKKVGQGFKKVGGGAIKIASAGADFIPFGGTVKKVIGTGAKLVGAFGRNSGQALSGQIRSGQTDFTFGQGQLEVSAGEDIFRVGIRQGEQRENAGFGQIGGDVTPTNQFLAGGTGILVLGLLVFLLVRSK